MHTHSQEARTEEIRVSYLEAPALVHQRHEGLCQLLDVCVCEVGNLFRKEVTCGMGICPETDHRKTAFTLSHRLYANLASVLSSDSGLPTNSCAQVILSEPIKYAPVWVVSPILQKVQLLQGLFLSLHSS